MLTIYYHPLSFPSLSSLFTAEALGLEYERKVVNLQDGEQRSEDYVKINSFSRVPALKDRDFTLSESGAIMRYLARREGSRLYSEDIQEAATIDRWLDYVTHHLRTDIGRIQFHRMIGPMLGQEPNQETIEMCEGFVQQNLAIIEEVLSAQRFLCADHMTLADIMLVTALEPEKTAKLDLTAFPALTAWLTARRSEPFYTNVHSHFGAELGL